MTSQVSLQAEQSLLGSVLLDTTGKLWLELASLVSPGDAATPEGQIVISEICRMVRDGHPLETGVLISELARIEHERQVPVLAYINDLKDGGLTRESAQYHASTLKDQSNKRHLITACERTITQAHNDNTQFGDCWDSLNTDLLPLIAGNGIAQMSGPKEITPSLLNDIHRERSLMGCIGLPTGIAELDESTTGIRAGELWIIGALPSRGKTALMQQIASENASNGTPVGLFSLEMSKGTLLRRIWLNTARSIPDSSLSAYKIRDPRMMHNHDFEVLQRAAEMVLDWPLFIDDSSGLTISELVARAKLMIHKGCRLICVDYLRLVQHGTKLDLREGISLVTDSLRQLAKDTGVPVIALSQLRRPRELNDPPTMIDLKESGDIEAHAHVVLLLYRRISEGRFTGEDEIIIGKCREGEIRPVAVEYDKQYLVFKPRRGWRPV